MMEELRQTSAEETIRIRLQNSALLGTNTTANQHIVVESTMRSRHNHSRGVYEM